MKKMRIKIVAILLSCILLANSFSVNINAEEQDLSYEAEIMPVNSKGRNTSTGLRIKIIPSTEKFVHGDEIEVIVEVKWLDKKWNAILDGTALVYKDENVIMLMGSVCGDNYESDGVSKFMGIDFTYDIISGKCIATASYDAGTDEEYFVEFGENSDYFSDAMNYLASLLEKAHNKQVMLENTNVNLDDTIMPRIDDGLYTYFTVSNTTSTVILKMWGAKELLVSGNRVIGASVRGNVSNAKTEILKIEPTAESVVATNCNLTYSGSSEVRFSNNEMKPKTKSSNINFSIPLPAGQSYTVNWTVSSINASTGTDDKTTVWKVYDVAGIDELLKVSGTSGAGFQNNLYCAPSSIPSGGSRQITLTGTAKVGYHYIYIDETGKTNNTTKYFSISNNTKLTVVNP